MLKQSVCMVLVAIFSNVTFAQQNTNTSFRAAVVKVDITPKDPQWLRGYNPRQSTSVLDSLYHRIVLLDDGKTQFFLISSDVLGIPSPEYDKVASILQTKHGIDPLNVWWSATHTHSAPQVAAHFRGIPFPSMANRSQLAAKNEVDTTYTAMLEERLIAGILEARRKLQPARLGVGWGFSQANINRRAIDVDGKASLGLNPDGEVDRRIGVLRIDREDGKPLALIANYPIHGTVLGQDNQKISGDAPGVVSQYVEKKIGAPVLFINGAAGNLAPIYSVYPNERAGHLREFCVLLGDKIIEANHNVIASKENVTLATHSLIVETPRRPDLGWSPDLEKYASTTSSGVNMVKLPIRFMKINDDIAIWSAPVEMFCEISNRVRARSPFPFTFFLVIPTGRLAICHQRGRGKKAGMSQEFLHLLPR